MVVNKIRRCLNNYIKIMKIFKTPKKDIELIENLLLMIEKNSNLIEEMMNLQLNVEKDETEASGFNTKDRNLEIYKNVGLARKLESVVLNEEDNALLTKFLNNNEILKQFIGNNEKKNYELLTSYDHADFSVIELQFLYLYLLKVGDIPKYNNKLSLFKNLTAMLYQRIYMNSFEVKE